LLFESFLIHTHHGYISSHHDQSTSKFVILQRLYYIPISDAVVLQYYKENMWSTREWPVPAATKQIILVFLLLFLHQKSDQYQPMKCVKIQPT